MKKSKLLVIIAIFATNCLSAQVLYQSLNYSKNFIPVDTTEIPAKVLTEANRRLAVFYPSYADINYNSFNCSEDNAGNFCLDKLPLCKIYFSKEGIHLETITEINADAELTKNLISQGFIFIEPLEYPNCTYHFIKNGSWYEIEAIDKKMENKYKVYFDSKKKFVKSVYIRKYIQY